MKKSKTSGSVLIPHDLNATPNTIVEKDGRKHFAADRGPASKPGSATAQNDQPTQATMNERNANALRDALVDLQSKGLVKFASIETPPLSASSPTMTLKEFKAAFANKPGATFHCPEHLKHELED
jgi:hypothetical protein